MAIALVGAAAVLALVAGAAVVGLTRDDAGGRPDFGGGPIGEPEEDWAVDLDDADSVSLVSDGERVYVVREESSGDDEDFDHTTFVTAYAADDGEELWEHELGDGSTSDPVRPLGDDEVVVAGYDDDTTALVDGRTGEVVWEADGEPVEADVSIGLPVPFGPGGPPDVVLLSDTARDESDEDDRVVAVGRDDGAELWDVGGPDDALLCDDVVVTLTEDEGDPDEPVLAQRGEVTGRDASSGEELWSVQGTPGLCDEHAIAVATDDEVRLVELGSGDEGEAFDVPGAGSIFGVPAGDRLVVSWFDFELDESDTGVVVYPRGGGDPVFEEDGSFGLPVNDDLLLVTDDEGEDVRLVRTSDGEEVGERDLSSSSEGSCAGALTLTTALFCEEGEPEVTGYALDEGFDELWTVDVGAGVIEATVGGDRLFAVTDDDELVALR